LPNTLYGRKAKGRYGEKRLAAEKQLLPGERSAGM
jgi:hypothetical protein